MMDLLLLLMENKFSFFFFYMCLSIRIEWLGNKLLVVHLCGKSCIFFSRRLIKMRISKIVYFRNLNFLA